MLELGLKTLIAYLLGSLMGALLVGSVQGVDIREQGSGNAGGTNALRTQGFGFAAATVVIDVAKGWLAAGFLPGFEIPGVAMDPSVERGWLTVACAAAAVIGHIWPQFHEFRGGKGGATLVGTLLVLAPWTVAVALTVWFFVVMLTGLVGLATMTAAVSVPMALWLLGPDTERMLAFAVTMAVLIVVAHRSNIARMNAGSEPRLNRLWLLRPRNPRP